MPDSSNEVKSNDFQENLNLADINVGDSERENKSTDMLQQQLDQLQLQEPKFKFWNTQPVPKLEEIVTENTYINTSVAVEKVQQEPYNLPNGMHWNEIDLTDPGELKDLYTFLSLNYVEDNDNMFRFDYSPELLQWILMPPGWQKFWHLGIRIDGSNKLIGFLGAYPAHIQVYEKDVKCIEYNFLCVHQEFRSIGLCPLLIQEIIRRANLKGIFQATFTAGIIIPKPIASCRYWHRSLNPKKLIETRFSSLKPKMTMEKTIEHYNISKAPLQNIIPLQEIHVKSAYKLLMNHLKNYKLYPLFTEAEFKHHLLPRKNVIYSYVLVDEKENVTDLCSFYNLPITVLNHSIHKEIKAAYSYYNVATTISFKDLLHNALIMAKKANFDGFNALDIMKNDPSILKDLKFLMADGFLQYYLYNWKCPDLSRNEIGFVLQ
uniref:Glycylpeptide N-tetradecanoyltransferase n=1 Tax=Panagrolaimus davidi TaxID=227884 RepID=A0A914Q6N8_9BILA